MVDIVHMVGHQPFKLKLCGPDVTTRCGKIGFPTEWEEGGKYTLVGPEGNPFFGTTKKGIVSCQKCSNLLKRGSIHVRK
jgi:hypothetical protein